VLIDKTTGALNEAMRGRSLRTGYDGLGACQSAPGVMP
jgi:hypothetical protein